MSSNVFNMVVTKNAEVSKIEPRNSKRVRASSAQNRALRHEYEDVKRHNESLKSLVARYQKELKDQSRSVIGVPPPPASSVSPAPSSTSVPPAMKDSQPLSSAMNVNKASAGDMVLVLGLSKDVADRIVTNRPYRVKGELVAKNVLPKETFDLIKERINAVPNRSQSPIRLTGRPPHGGRPVRFLAGC